MESVTQFIFSQTEKDVETFFTFLTRSYWVSAFLAPEENIEMNKCEQRRCADRFVQRRFKKIHKPNAELWLKAWGQPAPKISQNKLKKKRKRKKLNENQPPKHLKELFQTGNETQESCPQMTKGEHKRGIHFENHPSGRAAETRPLLGTSILRSFNLFKARPSQHRSSFPLTSALTITAGSSTPL